MSMQTSYNADILRGGCQELPNVRSKVVRIFLSSTFSDTLAERDSLIEHVFPRLKDYCREKYGLEFQYADMRWGIQTASSDNHSEVQTCLNEIELCRKYSLATNFVVLLSHRYGSRPVPATIRALLFEQLHEILRSNASHIDDAELLSQWYQLDTNPIPAVYVLRSISSILPKILSPDTIEMKAANKEWKKVNNRIHKCLRIAAIELLKQGQILEDEYDDFFISVTEKEIVKGILSVSNANERTLCFLREIEDISDHLIDRKASKFIDMTSSLDGQLIVDSEAETLLNRLKYTRIPNVLQSQNIFSYKVRWESDGINQNDHAEYITRFNKDFYDAIQKQIDHCVQTNAMVVSEPLQREVLEHAIQCKTYITKFHGRTDVMDKLEKFIDNTKEHRPCIVYGASGCGKTSVLAKVANEAMKWWSSKSVSVILRFLGTTPSSSTISKTLLSISQHICQLYKLSMQIYSDVQQLRHQLERNLFIQIPSDEYLIIILDSIDQLETDAYDCQWLPRYFPENIKCIVSTLPDHGNILANLKSLINNDSSVLENTEHLLVFVPPFQPAIVEIVYNDWLKMKQRSLSVEQRVFITSLMEKQTEILPLYMKLVFDIVSTWHSYDPINNAVRRLTSIDACIRYLFDQLEKIHSSMLFSRAICYMTACRNGISQNELEDVLSLDDDVLKSVFQHYIPPVRRVPGILWTRIRNDLDEYITEKEVDDSPVIYWYHRRFIEFVNDAYISALDDDERKTIVENMIDLYKETWKGKSKPFKIDNPNLLHKYNLSQSDGRIDANRLITSQPIEFIDIHGQVQFNRRKLNELPQFLSQLTSSLAIPVVAEEIVFNYCFMYAKLRCSPFNDIVSELVKFTQVSSYRLSEEVLAIKCEMIIFYMVYMISGIKLQEYPNNYAFELSARLLILYGIKPNITRLLKQLDEQSIHHCALIVPYTQLPPASGLIFSMHLHTTSIVEIDFTDNNMTTISLSDKIVVFDIEQLKTVLTVNLPQLNEPYLNSTTLTGISYDNKNNENESSPSGGSDPTRFQRYSFLVNSLHHLYLISAQEKIKFHRASKIGFLTVEILCSNRGLAVIAEINGDSIECWDLVNDRLFDRIQCSSSPIQAVQCLSTYNMIITKLKDGTISFHSITDWTSSSFVLRASIKSDIRLDLIIPVGHFLLCTFDATSSICFALIDIKSFNRTDRVLSNQEILKTLITFDPPMTSKPIERIVLPDENLIKAEDKQPEFPLFIAKTKDTLYVVHQCKNKTISYVQINGQYDVICIYPQEQKIIFTSHRSIIEMHKWACVQNEVENSINIPDCLHKYQLYVSIDTGSAHVTAIMPSLDYATVFLCSMQNGVIQAYSATHAREALECIPPFERSTHVTKAIQLLRATAITVDVSKRELTSWSYQHSASIQSTHVYHAAVTISEFAIVPSNADPQMIFVFVLTSNHYIEIYSNKALDKEPLFTYFLRYPAKIHSRMDDTFLLLTNRGSIHSIAQRTDPLEFHHLEHIQLKTQCSMMFSSIVTLHSSEHLIILSDDGQSMAIWTSEQVIIYVEINTPALPLKSLHGHSIQDSILLYLPDKTLISCRIQLDQSMNSGSVQMNPCGRADQFCFKNHYLMTWTSEKNQLDLQDIRSKSSHQQIQLENPCEHLCFNESSTYVFVVVKPRILFMFRTIDGQQLAKLFLFDFVSSMIADNNFIVLAMTDRRLLTLMIADPKDPTVQTKIQALPSRNPQLANESMTSNLLQHLEKYANNSSVEEERDFNDDDNQSDHRKITQKTVPPVSHLCIVTRLTGRHSLSKMSSNPAMTSQIMTIFSYNSENQDVADLIHDSDSDDDVECSNPLSTTIQQQPVNDSQDIYQKILQHEQEQIKGIQLANAGSGNLNVVNNYSVTSNTCVLI